MSTVLIILSRRLIPGILSDMGSLDSVIFENYKRALAQGDLVQAEKAIKLAKELKSKIEKDGFIDYEYGDEPITTGNNVITPLGYSFDEKTGMVKIKNTTIALTKTETRLFKLFSKNESTINRINLITKDIIKESLWPNKIVSNDAIRVSIYRLREKIEPNPKSPIFIVNFYNKGYVFWGKKIYSNN